MNYRHAFHAGNHADVLKHITVLALTDALLAKPTDIFALDTHAGRGTYSLASANAQATQEADGGISRLLAEAPNDALVQRYLHAVTALRTETTVDFGRAFARRQKRLHQPIAIAHANLHARVTTHRLLEHVRFFGI